MKGDSILDFIGKTPLMTLKRFGEGLPANISAKLEYFNPAGSAKDRPALYMVIAAEKSGNLRPGGTIIEPTSGNTGIGLACVAASRGYRAIFTMPDTMSIERRQLLSAYGAEVVLTDGKLGMAGAVARANELQAEIPGSIVAGQFENPANPMAHEMTTGPEIWEDSCGQVDAFVAGVGTGGTLTGVARFLKKQNCSARIIAVEPSASPLLSQGKSGPHGLMGIGSNFIPENLDRELVDEVITVSEEQAYKAARDMARKEGVLVGISSGAALHAARILALRPEFVGRNIVVLLPDGGERYLSTDLFD